MFFWNQTWIYNLLNSIQGMQRLHSPESLSEKLLNVCILDGMLSLKWKLSIFHKFSLAFLNDNMTWQNMEAGRPGF